MVVVGATVTPRSRASVPTPGNTSRSPSLRSRKAPRSTGWWVMIGVPTLLLTVFAWQVISPMLRSEAAVRNAVGFSRVSLEADPAGARIDFAVVDQVGQETTLDGEVNIRLREPDGTLWQTTREITAANFAMLPAGGLLAGRTGYSVVIPASDWPRAPRRGGSATVSVTMTPTGRVPFSTVTEERFP